MQKDERKMVIMREINLHNKVLSADLSTLLQVSDDTVRRDIKELVAGGSILKVHGGAVSKSFATPFSERSEVYAREAKQQIAAKAIRLLRNDMVILTEGGTTILELARMIPDSLRATFFTISPQVAITLSEHPNLEVITIGGKLYKNANLHLGASVINQLAEVQVDLCFLGANAFSAVEGLTDLDWEVVQVKKAIIRAARKVALLAIAEKLDTTQRIRICPANQVGYLITELSPDNPRLQGYLNGELKLL